MASTALRLQPTTVPPGPFGPVRPSLRVLDGGRAPARVAERAMYRRRRVVAVLLAVAVTATILLATAAVTRTAGGAPSTAGAPPSAGPAATVVVRPGDTLWSIAAATAPEIDVRIAVDRIVALNGSSPIVTGQELVLPG